MSTDRTRWQYAVANIGIFNAASRMAVVLGSLGAQGFELVTVYDKSSNWFAGMEKGFMLFKRAVPPGTEPDGAWYLTVDERGELETPTASNHGYPDGQAW